MHDKFKKRFQAPKSTDRVRRQIAVEAARRLYEAVGPEGDDPDGRLRDASEADYYTAKRKAAAVLGQRVRPGDLPTDSEVRDEVIVMARARAAAPLEAEEDAPTPELATGETVGVLAEHLDRFQVYRMRLTPLEAVKQNPRTHPEGDALFHSLQVFEQARLARPYDEEFLLAALLHDVGKAINPSDHSGSAVEALRGAVTERTLWLVEHHMDLVGYREKGVGGLASRFRKAVEGSEYLEDLKLLRDLDDAGRVPGAPVGTVDDALAYLKGLEDETYLGE